MAQNLLDNVYEKIWDTNFWLIQGVTWPQMLEHTRYSLRFSVCLCFILAAIIYIIRIMFERFIATPIGKSLSIKDKLSFSPNDQLEKFYKSASSKEFNDPIIRVIYFMVVVY